MFYDARKRAIALDLPFNIEPEDIVVPAICPVLGIPMVAGGSRDSSPSLDRKIPANGYVKGNIFVISFRANRIKADASVAEMAAVLAYMQEEKCAI